MSVSVYAENSAEMVQIKNFGYEKNGKQAKWGPGIRTWTILHYVIEGKGYFNGKMVEKGQGFLIREGKLHEYHSDELSPWQYFWVIFKSDIDISKIVKTDENDIFQVPFLTEVIDIKNKILQSKRSISSFYAKECLYKLINLHEKVTDLATGNIRLQHIDHAKQYMEIYYGNPIKISDVSKHIFISERYMYNLFMEYEKISPKEYLTNLRIKKAKEMLVKSNVKISEIARSVGYNDALSFSKLFSAHTGLSPTNYRIKNT